MMERTSEKPTVAGWYWAWAHADGPADMISVAENGRGKLRAKMVGIKGNHAIWGLPVELWAGPVAPGDVEAAVDLAISAEEWPT